MLGACIFKFAPFILLYFLVLFPGFIFGLLLLSIDHPVVANWKSLLFLTISTLLYILCFWLIDIFHTTDVKLYTSLKLVGASCIGSLILSIAYQWLLTESLSLKSTIINLLVVGVACSIPSAALILLINTLNYNELDHPVIGYLLFCSPFVIYPLWQAAFVWVMQAKATQPITSNDLTE
jgi:hypothetical protein